MGIRERRESDPQGCRRLIKTLYEVACGLRKLGKTYGGDCAIGYKIAAMRRLIGTFVEESIERRHRSGKKNAGGAVV